MTSSSYVTTKSVRPTIGIFYSRHASNSSFTCQKQLNTSISALTFAHHENKTTNWIPKNFPVRNLTIYTVTPRNSTRNKKYAGSKSFTILRNDLLTQRGSCSEDSQTQTSLQYSNILCSYRKHNKVSDEDLKSAPTLDFTVRNLSTNWHPTSKHSLYNSHNMKLSYPSSVTKDGESSWEKVCGEINTINFKKNVANHSKRVFSSNSATQIFQAICNYKCYQNLLVKHSYFEKRMSLSLLLDPIVGSPPSSLNSPFVEARDDVSALSEGFTRKVKLRRRLSTSFDEPSNYENNSSNTGRIGKVVGVAESRKSVENVGPFGFRSAGVRKECDTCGSEVRKNDNDYDGKKIQLNTWLEELHQEAIKAESGTKGNFTNNDDTENSSRSLSGHDDDDDDGSSKRDGHVVKISEDLFQLLEKVIGCKGRNISHITVEQSVKQLCTVFMDASDNDKLNFFTILAEKYGVDHEYVTATAGSLATCKEYDARLTLEEKLRGALVPKSQWLFTQIARLENGVKFLVDMRVDLLDAIESSKGKSSLKALNNSLRDLIGMWFNVGFLNLERVTWQSSCDMLQKISEYEAVHPMRNWTDLKKRVGPNRRCFVFTHNSMPDEPVVVLHTFLTDHISSSVQKIVSSHRMRMMSLDSDLPLTSAAEDPDSINTAIFYSITSTQRGLTGIELGNYLIKRVVRELQSEFPKMTQYSTLSPIPGFKNWLVGCIKNALKESTTSGKALFTEGEISVLKPIFESYDKNRNFYEVFLDVLKLNSWFSDERLKKEFEKPLKRLCAEYLFVVKRRGYALDPVANFHLKNGAVIWRINWLGDESPRGLTQSCGMMVNYRYFLETCEINSQNYMENQVIQISDQVKHFIK